MEFKDMSKILLVYLSLYCIPQNGQQPGTVTVNINDQQNSTEFPGNHGTNSNDPRKPYFTSRKPGSRKTVPQPVKTTKDPWKVFADYLVAFLGVAIFIGIVLVIVFLRDDNGK